MDRILLLGKDGQVGWELQRSLALHGELKAIGRRECDLSDRSALRLLIRDFAPSVIVNAAAYTAVDRAESDTDMAYRINAEVPATLAEEMAARGGLLIHYSTDYVFDGTKPEPYLEDDAVNPQNVYGLSKLAGEQAILRSGARAAIFRTSWVFGERGGNFVKTILRLARERDALNVVADQIGSPTPAAMIADATSLALARLRQGDVLAPGEARIYHLAAARPVSWHAFAQAIVQTAEALGDASLRLGPEAVRAIPASDYPTPAKRPANSRLDCGRLRQDFGIEPADWQPYLARMLMRLPGAAQAT